MIDALTSIFSWLTDTYNLLSSWRFSIGTILFWGLVLLICMLGSPKTAWLVPRRFKNWVKRTLQKQGDDDGDNAKRS